MAWLLVLVAGIFETGFAVLLKQIHGITRVWPTVGFALCADQLRAADHRAAETGGRAGVRGVDRDRGRRNLCRWSLWHGEPRRGGKGRCRCRR